MVQLPRGSLSPPGSMPATRALMPRGRQPAVRVRPCKKSAAKAAWYDGIVDVKWWKKRKEGVHVGCGLFSRPFDTKPLAGVFTR